VEKIPIVQVWNAQRRGAVDLAGLRQFARKAFERCLRLPGGKAKVVNDLSELNIVLVSDRRIAELHRRFMNIAGATDVLTFQHGEIVASVETAQRNAARFGCSVDEEIKRYIVHGFLHLLGLNDKTAAERKTMERAQEKILRSMRSGSR
jgi:probable rRNA maturation factor